MENNKIVNNDRIMFNDRTWLIQEEPRGATMMIEVPITSVGNSFSFPLVQELQSDLTQIVIIKSLRVVTFAELANAPTLGLVNATLAELKKVSLILYSNGWQKGYLIPLLSLNNVYTETSLVPYVDRSLKMNNWQKVEWNKCKLVYSNGTPSAGVPYAILFEVEYIRYDKNGQEIQGTTV